MAQSASQSFEHHARVVPGYHLAALGIFTINLLWSIYRLVRVPSLESLVGTLLAVGYLLLFFYARRFALTVQDRVIRLEMRLRMRELLPTDLHGRIGELSHQQLIALRFASDEELPDLCRTVLADNLTSQKSIKKMIKHWKADHLRV